MMRVETEVVIVLVLLSLLESQGSIKGLQDLNPGLQGSIKGLQDLNPGLGGISTGPQGCTSTCCMTCQLGDNCEICYKLNPPGSPNCPCIDSLDLQELRRLLELPLSLAQSRGRTGVQGDVQGGGSRTGIRGGVQGGGCVPEC